MSESSPLYRHEAISYQRDDSFSHVILKSPIFLTLSSLISCFLIVIILIVIFIGSYTKKSTLKGQLLPDRGVIKVYSPTKAKVTEKKVNNGDLVKKGDILYVVTTERNTIHGDINKVIIERLNTQIDSLTTEQSNVKHQFEEYCLSIDQQHKKIQDTIRHLEDRVNTQKYKMQLLDKELIRYKILSKTGVISQSLLEQQKTKKLDQQDVLDTLNLQKESLQQQQLSLLSDKLDKKNFYTSQITQLAQTITALKNEGSQYESNKEIIITSPVDGTVTNALPENGQSIETETPLLSIIPSNSVLEAVVYAPSTDIGFIHKGQDVLIRYDAFPYEKFGLYNGIVSSISHSSVNYDETSDT
ncbi:TPA: HlyD family efflux transporter periplasmic adaptor subunit, partial [Escherichia coli]|nr:HlyD family efflux transporter periplasmic adaptor subunit [Escherichia coli]